MCASRETTIRVRICGDFATYSAKFAATMGRESFSGHPDRELEARRMSEGALRVCNICEISVIRGYRCQTPKVSRRSEKCGEGFQLISELERVKVDVRGGV